MRLRRSVAVGVSAHTRRGRRAAPELSACARRSLGGPAGGGRAAPQARPQVSTGGPPHIVLIQCSGLTRQTFAGSASTGDAGGESKTSKAKTTEPNVDFELDVKVHINSGKCVLHTREPSRDDDAKT